MKNLLKSKRLPRPRRKIDIGIIALLVLGGYFLVYKPVVTWQDKQRFKEAEKAIEQLYTEIESKVGKPSTLERSKSCSHASRKFEQGPLGCSVYLILAYGISDSAAATDLFLQSERVIASRGDLFATQWKNPIQAFSPLDSTRGVQDIGSDYIVPKTGDKSCSIKYSYRRGADNDFSEVLTIEKMAPENVFIQIICGGPARAEHYPTKN